jgi:hypothetical protein
MAVSDYHEHYIIAHDLCDPEVEAASAYSGECHDASRVGLDLEQYPSGPDSGQGCFMCLGRGCKTCDGRANMHEVVVRAPASRTEYLDTWYSIANTCPSHDHVDAKTELPSGRMEMPDRKEDPSQQMAMCVSRALPCGSNESLARCRAVMSLCNCIA